MKIPSKEDLRDWLAENPGQTTVREVSRAFGVKGAGRIEIKALLRELESDGAIAPRKRRHIRDKLPPVAMLLVTGPDKDGDLFAEPVEWGGPDRPRILILQRPGEEALGRGDRILAKLLEVRAEDYSHQARMIRKIGTNPQRILGIFRRETEGGRILPIDRGSDREWRVPAGLTEDARDGELVEAERHGPARLGLPRARVVARLGDPGAPKAVSLIAIHHHGIPDHFPDAVIAQADAAQPLAPGQREDLRDLALLTIDPWDARDHDDAVCALPREAGGFVVWVAIADVAAYVRPQSALDREARLRGNSTYFPDRVVPMLPDALSGDLCSLHEGVDRPVIAVRMEIDETGHKVAHRFCRAMMRSAASLSYEQAQAAFEGQFDDQTAPLAEGLRHLHAAWRSTLPAREARQPLDLDLPERQIVLADDGRVTSVAFKDRLDAHRLIEEFMVLANVAAAEELIERRSPLLFRVHEEPAPDKIDALREIAHSAGFVLAKGQVMHTRHLNRLLAQAQGSEFDELINMSTLRSMTQAYYSAENYGHFGLALRNYAHFTSPIRRYADLIVHRALITAQGWGDDGLSAQDIEMLGDTAKAISDTERRSMAAERETTDRYLAAFLADRVGAEMAGRVSGVQRFGLFIKLDETGADGLVPIRALGNEFFHHDADAQTLTGEKSGQMIGLGQRVRVKLAQSDPVTGGLLLEVIEIEGTPLARPSRGKSRYSPRKPGADKAARAKTARKRERTRR
jgi:ribonuclease R